MAARRLLIVMLILLGLSTLAAALVDTDAVRNDGTGSTMSGESATSTRTGGTEPAAASEAEAAKRLGLAIDIGRRINVIPVKVGDQLTLRVRWNRSGLVEIAALGLLEPVAPGAPARFDLLAREPANYGVRLLDPERLVARIEVSKLKKQPRGAGKPRKNGEGAG
ncbi:MAG TPA: hypothetical protein VE523_09850 [Solirubrobacterales bacterium]|jgi:hypothetical protein|nr:hypothetical protein [Solirubrobacterales bacterium]